MFGDIRFLVGRGYGEGSEIRLVFEVILVGVGIEVRFYLLEVEVGLG